MVGGLVTKAGTPPPGTPPPPSPPPPPATEETEETQFTSSDPAGPSTSASDADDDHLPTCPHGVACVPPGRPNGDVVTCMLCQETRDDVGTMMTSQVRRPRVRRAATVATTGTGTLEALPEREEMTGTLQGVAMEGAGGGVVRTRAGGITKSSSTPALPSHEFQPVPPSMTRYSMFEGSSTQSGHRVDVYGQDLRRTQSLKSLFCLPGEEPLKEDRRLVQAHECPRVSGRRNALNDPFKMTMPQETRERIQRETQQRKTSVKLRVSRYLRSLVDEEPEVDLI